MDLESPWGTNELKRLSRHIRDDVPAGIDHPPYDEVMAWYNDVAAHVQKRIAGLNWPPLLLDRPFEVTSRPKTIDTLREKLLRERSTPLPSVQDTAGVRFEAEMSLDEQDAVVTAICGVFDHRQETCVRDLRVHPHSGYRAVHIWLRLPARVEVQVRTHLQGEWANMYEYAADVYGREIRYGSLPSDAVDRKIVQGLQELSTGRIADMERDRNEIATIDLSLAEIARGGFREIPSEVTRRLDKLKERGLSNEEELRSDLVFLKSTFQELRRGRE